MSAMERLKVWLNQHIAKILGDLQEREPVKDPSPTRAGCRIFFMLSLLLGFSSLLWYNFMDAPDARVVQIPHVKPGGKNDAFPSCFRYDRSSPYCEKWPQSKFPLGVPVSCPCANTSTPWKKFVKFQVLHENSTDWNMKFTWKLPSGNKPEITVPDTIPLGNESIVKDTKNLTAENFCNLSSLWPNATTSTTSPGMVEYYTIDVAHYKTMREYCIWMATLLFPGSNRDYEDRTRSTQFLNTPSLLNREDLNTLLAQLARDSVLTRRLALDMALSLDADNADFRRFYNALARQLTGLLDRDEMHPNVSYIYGAQDLSLTLSSNQFYDKSATVWYLGDDSGPIFLQTEIDWEAYYQFCFPEYCEVTKPMGEVRKLYWAFGILGGVATVVLAVVTKLLWPCTAMFLVWNFKRKTAGKRDPERPQGALLAL